MASYFTHISSIHCNTIERGKFSQYFNDEDIKAIRQYELDVILRFGFGIIRGEIHNVPTFGVWSFHHDDEEKYRGGPPCFWEIYNGDEVTGAILQRLTDKLDAGVVLKKGFFATVNYSYAKNIDQSYYETAKWPAQICRDIYNENADYIHALPSKTKAPIYHAPNNFQTLLFLAKLLRNFVSKGFRALFFREKWNIGIVHQPIWTFLEPNEEPPKIHWAPTPKKGKFLADPFGIEEQGKIAILCEDFDYRSKGVLSMVELTDGTAFSHPKPVMERPFHMSYPYLLKYRGEVYCVPETHEAGEISLYKAQNFPYDWKKVGTLISGIRAVDPTIFQYEGLWWLICTDEDQGPALNLFVWYATDLMGPWKPHIGNPVKTDVRSCRPAGTPFMHEGFLYRPAQDCSQTYGGRIIINRINQLTPTRFAEESVRFLDPPANSAFGCALHTLSSVGDFTLVDGKRWEFTLTKVPSIVNLWRKR